MSAELAAGEYETARPLRAVGDGVLLAAAALAPGVFLLASVTLFVQLFDLPWFRYGFETIWLCVPVFTIGLSWAAGSIRSTSQAAMAVRWLIFLLPPLLMSVFSAVYWGDPLVAILIAPVYAAPLVALALPVVFPSHRGSAAKIIVGIVAAGGALWLLGTLVFIATMASPRDDPLDGIAMVLVIAGSLLGCVWATYAASANLADGLTSRRRVRGLPVDPSLAHVLDDSYIQGLVTGDERRSFLDQHDAERRRYAELVALDVRARAPLRNGRLLVAFGIIGTTLAVLGLVAVGISVFVCFGDDVCWEELNRRPDLVISAPPVAGLAVGMGVAAVAAGALLMRRADQHADARAVEIDALGARIGAARESVVELARARRAGQRQG